MIFDGSEVHTPDGISFELTDIVRIEPHRHAESARTVGYARRHANPSVQ